MVRASTLPYVPLALTSVDHHRFVSTAYSYFAGSAACPGNQQEYIIHNPEWFFIDRVNKSTKPDEGKHFNIQLQALASGGRPKGLP